MLRLAFNDNWYMRKESTGEPEPLIGPLTVPHDAMLAEQRDPATPNSYNTGYFPGGIYRYSRDIEVPEQWRGKSVTLEFEGVYHRSQVFVNGKLAGGRASGYARFHVSLEPHLDYGASNRIEVVANNAEGPNTRWYTGSGIYRPVNLLIGDPVRIGPTGQKIRTVSVDGDEATLEVSLEVVNDLSTPASTDISSTVVCPSGDIVGPAVTQVELASGQTTHVSHFIIVPKAALWSPDSPALHQIQTTIRDDQGHVDESQDTFGIRTITADAKHGLRINGKTLKLYGACIHHDNGVIGAHTLEAAEDRRIRILKANGYNAIRSAHNPTSSALLRACDRHGMLVMDELTDVWYRSKHRYDYSMDFADWWERDLESMINRDYNHPSVIMYSIGNEIAETSQPRGIALNKAMAARVRDLDSTRFVTNGINGFLNRISPTDEKWEAKRIAAETKGSEANERTIAVLNLLMGILRKVMPYMMRTKKVDVLTRDAFAELDIAGYNYLSGRYRVDAKVHPDRVIVSTEANVTDSVRAWSDIERLPHVIGEFVWTGWDYIGEAGIATRRYNDKARLFLPYPALLAGEPIIDITGHAQTQAYLNRFAWHQRTIPHIAVEPLNHVGEKQVKTGWRSTNSISSWSWEGYEGTTAVVEVYADAPKVELRLNDKVIGAKRIGAKQRYLAKFEVPYAPGTLTAIAYGSNGVELGRAELHSADATLKLSVQPESSHIKADGSDLLYVPIELTDEHGTLRPLADRTVTIAVDGAATLLGFGSAEAITTEAFTAADHRTFYGRALAVIRAGHTAGEVRISVSAEGCQQVVLTVPVLGAETE